LVQYLQSWEKKSFMSNNFIDTHCHALWDFDDGAKSKEESLALLRVAYRTGIKTLFVTPHKITDGIYDPTREEIERKLNDLKILSEEHKLPLELKFACEFRINEEAINAIIERRFICYQDTDWLLIEFTRRNMKSQNVQDAVYELDRMGVKLLIAHPERYFDNEKQALDTCRKWQSWGCHFQINRTSLMGIHGVRADKISWLLVSEGLAHIVASDAHQGEGRRECRLDDVYGMIERRFEQKTADQLCIINPNNLKNNQSLSNIEIKKAWWRK
jgi:protein-tyrosine phosphatase